MLQTKMGSSAAIGIIIVCAVVLTSATVYLAFIKDDASDTQVSIVPASMTSTGDIVQPSATVSCPSDGTTDGQVRYENDLASTVTYGNPTVYFVPKTAGVPRVTAGTLQTDGTHSTAVNLKCTDSGTRWQATAVTSAEAYSSAVGEDFVAEGAEVKVELVGQALDAPKFRIEDKFTGGAKYFNISNCVDSTASSYAAFTTTICNISNDAAITGTSLTLGTDEYIDARIYLKVNETKHQFGENGLRTFLLVDADGSDWAEPIVSRNGGAKLVDVKTSLSADDLRQYSGYEYAYEIGMISDKEDYVDFYMQSAAGVNPDYDPIVELCAEGRYNSVKETDTIKIGCWTDAASQTEVGTVNRPYLRFDIA